MTRRSNHNCTLFEDAGKAGNNKTAHANCGDCKHFNLEPPAPWSRICREHDKLVAWSKENYKEDWV